MPVESPALEKLKAARRWSRPDSATDPWTTLGSLGLMASRRARAPAPVGRRPKRVKEPPWGARDLGKAARLLEKPPLAVAFDDDQEMRRVYSLIYDVFRYKSVLEEALAETGFYAAFPEAEERKCLAWLLLFDQQRRRWAKRDFADEEWDTLPKDVYPRGRSRSRRKSSLFFSRDSSRDSSLEAKDGRHSRSSMLRSKALAIKEDDSNDSFECDKAKAAEAKARFQSMLDRICAKDVVGGQDDQAGVIVEEDEGCSGKVERKSSDESDKCAKVNARNAVDDQEFTISRNEMRDVMEIVAGEIGAMVKHFDEVLWEHKVRIAAAIAKIRIRNKALKLSELLPPHLRDERVTASSQRETLTGWVNVFKSRSITELVQRLNEMGYSYSTSKSLEPNQFRFDRICPKFISIRPVSRTDFVRSSMLLENIIILQEKEFCVGAAALCKALREAQLFGDVIQTHGTSPKAAAYLAAQLRDWPAYQGQLIVFGTGDRKHEYEGFMRSLGATNARILAEGAAEAGYSYWSRAVAALAAPPNSYSSVMDPIDLVCSRGGDLGMLEVLTESEINSEGRNRVMKILEEQKKILRLCMSKPQIQMIVYETHSALAAENGDMVKRAVSEANRAARELHAIRIRRARDAAPKAPKCANIAMDTTESEDENEDDGIVEPQSPTKIQITEAPSQPENTLFRLDITETTNQEVSTENENLSPDKNSIEDKLSINLQLPPSSQISSASTPTDPDSVLADVKVPDCDLFEEEYPYTLVGMPTHEVNGCFLAMIKRKEMIRMNAKYMINVAETRGLFGGNAPPPKKPPPVKKKAETQKVKQGKRKLSKEEMERIAAPTHAWSARVSNCSWCAHVECTACNACAKRHAMLLRPRARLWWRMAIGHVIAGRTRACAPLHLPRCSRPVARPPLPVPVNGPCLDVSGPHFAKVLEAMEAM